MTWSPLLGTCNLKSLQSISQDIEKQFDIYLNLFLTLLYADDIILMAESPHKLQNILDSRLFL
jgi:hypothetical protein